jgi:hypothetical protein
LIRKTAQICTLYSIAGEKVIGEPKVIPAEGSLSLNFVINADHKYIQCIQKDPVLAYGQWTFSVEIAPHDHRAREEESVDHPLTEMMKSVHELAFSDPEWTLTEQLKRNLPTALLAGKRPRMR